MSLLVGLLLLCHSTIPTCSQWQIDSNDLLYELFSISREESASMEQLMRQHTSNGVVDKAKYDEELQRLNPALYSKMTKFRTNYREIDERDKAASHFIDVVLFTARQARDQEITRQLETVTILDNFKGLPQSSRDYLIKKFPALKVLDSPFTEKPPYGLETSTSRPPVTTMETSTSRPAVTRILETSTSSIPSTTKVSPTSSTTVTATTSQHLSKAEINKLLDPAIDGLKKSSGKFNSITLNTTPIVTVLENFVQNPSSWSSRDFKNVFEQYESLLRRLSQWCNQRDSDHCKDAVKALASTLAQVLRTVAELYPTKSKLKELSSTYSGTLSAVSSLDQLLEIVLMFLDTDLY